MMIPTVAILIKNLATYSIIMFFKKGDNRGFFRKAVDAGHLGLKILSHPIVHTVANGLFGEN